MGYGNIIYCSSTYCTCTIRTGTNLLNYVVMRRNFDLPQATHDHMNVEYLNGLINVVPARGTGDRTGQFCVSWFTIEMYYKLLEGQQQLYPALCHMSLFLKPNDQVCATAVTQ